MPFILLKNLATFSVKNEFSVRFNIDALIHAFGLLIFPILGYERELDWLTLNDI